MNYSDYLHRLEDRESDEDFFEKIRRQHRKRVAVEFRREYQYGPNIEEKSFVWPDRTILRRAKSSGIVWAAVHGTDTICVVTRAGDWDPARAHSYLKHRTLDSVLRDFRKTVISELEDFASPDSQLSEYFGHSIPKPFGVVSVNLGSVQVHEESDHEASSAEYDVTAATKFLKEEMEGSTVDETIKSAISAFQILFQNKKFKAEEIEVSVMDPDYFISPGNKIYKDTAVKHLVMSDIEDYLAAINSSSVGSCSVPALAARELPDRPIGAVGPLAEPIGIGAVGPLAGNDENQKFYEFEGNDMFAGFEYDDEDKEADVLWWEAVDKNTDSRRKDWREAYNPKITEQIANLKRKLSTLPTHDWESNPDIGDNSRNKKKNLSKKKKEEEEEEE